MSGSPVDTVVAGVLAPVRGRALSVVAEQRREGMEAAPVA